MLIVARQGKQVKFPCKASFAAKFSTHFHLRHPLTRKPLREKTATCGGRKIGYKRALPMKFFFDIRVLIQ